LNRPKIDSAAAM